MFKSRFQYIINTLIQISNRIFGSQLSVTSSNLYIFDSAATLLMIDFYSTFKSMRLSKNFPIAFSYQQRTNC